MDRIILHIDVNNAFLSWTAVYMLKKGYKYDITVNAQLTDTDGSESLSKDGNGNEIITSEIPEKLSLFGTFVNCLTNSS